MKSFIASAIVGAAAAAPFSFPLSNGFPNLGASALADVERQAGGPIPNSPLPSNLDKATQTSFQLIAANEIFEVAYFTELYNNITHNVPGYECTEQERGFVERALYRIRAQEELHATGANAILKANGAQTVGPCKYDFPVSNFLDAIALANTFTDVVIGVLPVVQTQSVSVVQLLGGIEEQEAEQVGWFRTLQSKLPSAAPFLTPTTPEFALSAVAPFLVPGTCPPEYAALEKAIKSFPALNVVGKPKTGDKVVHFSITGTLPAGAAVAYISGAGLPITEPITNVKTAGKTTTFDAVFPANGDNTVLADGLIVAAVVKQNQKYSNAAAVAAATAFGPGLIEYN